jgi:hypothetical protein
MESEGYGHTQLSDTGKLKDQCLGIRREYLLKMVGLFKLHRVYPKPNIMHSLH